LLIFAEKNEMDEIIKNKSILIDLCKKYYVFQLFLFGSFAKKQQNEQSDIDFLVYFKDDIKLLDYADNFFDLMYELEKLYNRKIDLVSGKSLKNPYFISEIEKNKILIYDTNHQKVIA
jgi:predicted nucleotidyltransferase